MTKKKDLMIAVLATFCLTVALFLVVPTRSQSTSKTYDPWVDLNNDGSIDIYDAIILAGHFGTSGPPVTHGTPNITPSTTEYIYPISLDLNLSEVYILQGQGWENETGIWGGWNTHGRNVTYALSLNKIFFDAYPNAIRRFSLVLFSNGTPFGNPQLSVNIGHSVQNVTVNGEGCLSFNVVPALNNTVNWLDTSAFGDVEIAELRTST